MLLCATAAAAIATTAAAAITTTAAVIVPYSNTRLQMRFLCPNHELSIHLELRDAHRVVSGLNQLGATTGYPCLRDAHHP